ncbi:uncharacterized protein CLUP02_16432 [Colletotrichum lupini]|uniref:Uncharacterized protein n=1 Tax=Colletotrichum lupini TaxID=145971 RepID=A0A9Q8T8E8_9PEZI|nr:uncharacterized protein CLUP02_16432 [Colletotrichum lupini]UQC90900.1 hypothetical protein CLUP02_16432 [Colletotrichum lupini]
MPRKYSRDLHNSPLYGQGPRPTRGYRSSRAISQHERRVKRAILVTQKALLFNFHLGTGPKGSGNESRQARCCRETEARYGRSVPQPPQRSIASSSLIGLFWQCAADDGTAARSIPDSSTFYALCSGLLSRAVGTRIQLAGLPQTALPGCQAVAVRANIDNRLWSLLVNLALNRISALSLGHSVAPNPHNNNMRSSM